MGITKLNFHTQICTCGPKSAGYKKGMVINMNKFKSSLCAVICMVALTACTSEGEVGESTVTIDKKGKIVSVIVDEFGQEYYDKEDLKSYSMEEAAVYNAAHEENAVTLTKLEVKEGVVTVQMEYASAQDYAAFNSTQFFAGTIEEAYEAGYSLDITLQSVAEPDKTIGKSEILSMGNKDIVIAEEKVLYKLPSKALYIGQNEEVIKSTSVRKADGGQEDMIYIIY